MRGSKTLAVLVVCLAAGLAAGCSKRPGGAQGAAGKAGKKTLVVYVPCSIGAPFFNILDRYRAEHPDVTVEFDSGNSVVLKRQVLDKGQRPDVYIGTGPLEFDPLVEAGLLRDGSRRVLSSDTVLLTVPKGNPANVRSLEDLAGERVRLIAVPDPKHNTSGMLAVQAFQKLGLWDRIKDKVQFSEYGRDARKWVMDGKAPAGIMYRSCLYEDLQPDEEVRAPDQIVVVADLLAAAGMEEIATPGGVLNTSNDPDLAMSFLEYLVRPESRAEIARWQVVCAQMVEGAQVPLAPRAPAALRGAARVLVQAYYPLNEEHQFIADYVQTLPQKFGDAVQVEVVDFRSPEGYDKWRASGLTCGGVLVNGKYTAEITVNGEKKTCRFLRRLDTNWERADLEAHIASLLAQAGEKPAATR